MKSGTAQTKMWNSLERRRRRKSIKRIRRNEEGVDIEVKWSGSQFFFHSLHLFLLFLSFPLSSSPSFPLLWSAYVMIVVLLMLPSLGLFFLPLHILKANTSNGQKGVNSVRTNTHESSFSSFSLHFLVKLPFLPFHHFFALSSSTQTTYTYTKFVLRMRKEREQLTSCESQLLINTHQHQERLQMHLCQKYEEDFILLPVGKHEWL